MTLTIRAGTKCCKDDIQKGINSKTAQGRVMIFRHCTSKYCNKYHTKFQVIPPSGDKVLLWTSKKCYNNEGQMGEKLKI